jgi:hypothetical protein
MNVYISICEDMVTYLATGLVDEGTQFRALIDGRSGNHVCYNSDKTKAMVVLTSTADLDTIAALSYIIVTTPEELFGTATQAADPVLRALYDSIYDQSPVTDEFGNTHTPSRYFALPGGYDTSHLL